MFKQYLVVGFTVIALTGCLDVEDKSDEKVVAALEQQNELLQQQLEQSNQQKVSVTLAGVVANVVTGAAVNNASAILTFGSGTSQTASISGGNFQFTGTPANSDYELVIRSNTGEFLERTFYGRTRSVSSSGAVFQDLGKLEVAAGVERTFAVFDETTGDSISTLVFWGDANSGSGRNAESHYIKGSYDAATKRYKITVPEKITTVISASLDLDKDGINEYAIINNPSENNLRFYSENLAFTDNFFLIDKRTSSGNVKESVELRVSVVDANAQAIPGLALSVKDAINGNIDAIYDATTKQYVLTALLSDTVQVMSPAFSYQGKNYASSNLQVSKTQYPNVYRVSVYSYQEITFADQEKRVFNLVLQPTVYTSSSNIYVSSKTNVVDISNPEFKVFYSAPVTLLPDSAKLYQTNKLTITPGNQSADDLVLPGITEITVAREEVPVDVNLSLSNTLLTLSPTVALASGNTYEFVVGALMDKALGMSNDVSGDSLSFSVPAAVGEFNINDVRLDNNNNFTLGAPIKAENTAGQSVTYSYWEPQNSSSVYIYLPASISTLKSLTLRRQLTTTDNVSSFDNEVITPVNQSQIHASSTYVLSLASNEYLRNNSGLSVVRGASVGNGYWHYVYSGRYMPDNRAGYVNEITFSYSYETKAGVVATGLIKLPVQ